MLQRSNSGGDNDITFRLRVEGDPANQRAIDALKQQVTGGRQGIEQPWRPGGIPTALPIARSVGSSATSFGGTGGGNPASSSVSPPYFPAQPPVSYASRAADDDRLNRRFDTAQNRFAAGVGGMARGVGMLNMATGGSLEGGIRTLAGIEAGVAGYRGMTSIASGLTGMMATGGAAYTAGRVAGGLGVGSAAVAAGAALGYGFTYLTGNASQRANLWEDTTEGFGLHSRGADAEKRAAGRATSIEIEAAGRRKFAALSVGAMGDISRFGAGYELNRTLEGGNKDHLEFAKYKAKNQIDLLSNPTDKRDSNFSAKEGERLTGLKQAGEDLLRIEEQLGRLASETARTKAESAQFVTGEYQRQLSIEEQRLGAARDEQENVAARYGMAKPGQRASAERALKKHEAGGFLNQGEIINLGVVDPNAAREAAIRAGNKLMGADNPFVQRGEGKIGRVEGDVGWLKGQLADMEKENAKFLEEAQQAIVAAAKPSQEAFVKLVKGVMVQQLEIAKHEMVDNFRKQHMAQ